MGAARFIGPGRGSGDSARCWLGGLIQRGRMGRQRWGGRGDVLRWEVARQRFRFEPFRGQGLLQAFGGSADWRSHTIPRSAQPANSRAIIDGESGGGRRD
jgi:hypothetical protein